MKKLLIMILAASMLLSMTMAGAVAENAPTFRIFAGVGSMSPPNETKPIVQQLNEAAGINVEWENVTGDMMTERKNLIFAAGQDLPDAFMNARLSDYELMNYGEQGMLIPLQDYITPEIMPNLFKVLEKRPNMLAQVTMPDGNIYSLPSGGEMGFTGEDGNVYLIAVNPQFNIINTDWLKKLGLEMPTTMDEFYDVLVAFKTQDPNGNGKADEIPLSFIFENWTAGMTSFFAGFGFTDYNDVGGLGAHRGVVDGKVVYKAVSDQYKDAIAYLSKWYQEGLIDVEVFSQDAAKYISKGKNDEVILGSYVWWEIPEVVGYDRASMYELMPLLSGPAGDPVMMLREESAVGRGSFAISSDCKDPAKLLSWVDMRYDPIIGMQASYGPIGQFFEAQPDEKGVYVNAIPPAGTTEGEMKEIMQWEGPVYTMAEYYGTVFYMEERAQDRLDILRDFYFAKYKPDQSYTYPNVTFTAEENELINEVYADIKNLTSEKTALWLKEGSIEAEWDAYVAQLESMGLGELLNVWQAAYDRYQEAIKR